MNFEGMVDNLNWIIRSVIFDQPFLLKSRIIFYITYAIRQLRYGEQVILTYSAWKHMGQTATKPDKVNILKWEADDDVAVKLTNVTDDVLKSNNGTHSLVMDLLILMLTLLYQKVRNINYNRINIGLPLYKNNIYEINLH